MSHSSGATGAIPALGKAVNKGLDLASLFTNAAQTMAYARARPVYPPTVLNLITNNLLSCATGAPFTKSTAAPSELPSVGLAVDIGCGSGQLTTRLAAPPVAAKRVLGMDPSEAQLAQAAQAPNVAFLPGVVDDTAATVERFLASLPADAVAEAGFAPSSAPGVFGSFSGHVGLVTVAQAFHWFEYPQAFAGLRRVLSSAKAEGKEQHSGMLAIVSYDDPVFEDNRLNKIVHDELSHTTLGPYWSDRRFGVYSRCGDFLDAIDFSQWRCHRFVHGDSRWLGCAPGETGADPSAPHADRAKHTTVLSDEDGLMITKKVPLSLLVEYLKSWSSYALWIKAHTAPAEDGAAQGTLTAPDPIEVTRQEILALYPGEEDPVIAYSHPISVMVAQPIE